MSKNIKSVKEYRFVSSEQAGNVGSEEMNQFISKITEYNQFGGVLQETLIGSDGEITSKSVNTFDDKGNMVEDIIYEGEHEISGRTSYIYDEDGKLIKEIVHYMDDTNDEILYIYNDNILIEKQYFDSEGDMEQKESFSYENNKPHKIEIVGEDHRLVSGKYYEYDGSGRISMFVFFEGDEKISEKTIYDSMGRKEKALKYNSSGRLFEIRKYSYKGENDQIYEFSEETSEKHSTYRFEYDEDGRVIKQDEFNKQGELIHTLEQEFDSNGQLKELRLFYFGFGITTAQSPVVRYEYEYFE